MERFSSPIVSMHESVGDTIFLFLSLLVSVLLCFVAIPISAAWMVNNAAGLANRWLGPKSRALVINASTNNPEAFSMVVSMGLRRMGGWANPLGSLLANCYLMYGVAPVWVLGKFLVTGRITEFRRLSGLLWGERRLVLWHLAMALFLYGVGIAVLQFMTSGFSWGAEATATHTPETGLPLYVSVGVILVAVAVFLAADSRLKRNRPELFTDICDTHHGNSVGMFLVGTGLLIASCFLMNVLFAAWTQLYTENLEGWFGREVFTALHFFLGALITSLPELRVATENYTRCTAPDLNTALGSASYSNLVNVFIALLGLLVFGGLVLCGTTLPWE